MIVASLHRTLTEPEQWPTGQSSPRYKFLLDRLNRVTTTARISIERGEGSILFLSRPCLSLALRFIFSWSNGARCSSGHSGGDRDSLSTRLSIRLDAIRVVVAVAVAVKVKFVNETSGTAGANRGEGKGCRFRPVYEPRAEYPRHTLNHGVMRS